jgi:hypothetical protein
MVAQAKALRQALAGPNTRARGLVRKQIDAVLPGAKSQDQVQKRPKRGKMKAASDAFFRAERQSGARAWHDLISGEVVVRERIRDGAARAASHLENGLFSDPRLATSTLQPGDPYLARFGGGRGVAADPISDLNDLRTLLHEEMHGFSRLGRQTYIGIGRVLEEVGTELNARSIVQNLTPEIAANPVLRARFSSQVPIGAGSYQREIDAICDVVSKHAGVSREAAGELVRRAHVKGLCQGGPATEGPVDHMQAFVRALDVPADRAQLIERELQEAHEMYLRQQR